MKILNWRFIFEFQILENPKNLVRKCLFGNNKTIKIFLDFHSLSIRSDSESPLFYVPPNILIEIVYLQHENIILYVITLIVESQLALARAAPSGDTCTDVTLFSWA
ncbi:hypothetical protein BpHYR1_019765 [Brachionus plicatilis]|uniref:Uncharacterized protein n=1 Tax=Brachionus plicatilis TaxID=10195 RepID=A0A3M7PPV6_BRAPC|nr:hypothetical protein BpHYR1_019765 [Brachionus plicatilis]